MHGDHEGVGGSAGLGIGFGLALVGLNRLRLGGEALDLDDVRRGIVDDRRDRQRCTIAGSLPVGRAVGRDVVLGNGLEHEVQRSAFLDMSGDEIHLAGGGGVRPGGLVAVVVGGGDGAELELRADRRAAVLVNRVEAAVARVADQGELNAVEHIAVLAVDGVALGHVGLVGDQRVAAEDVGIGFVGILHEEAFDHLVLAVGLIEVRNNARILGAVAEAVRVLEDRAAVEHVGVGDAAVIAENGDGVLHAQGAVIGFALADEEVTLDVVAVQVLIVGHVVVDRGSDDGGLAGGELDSRAVEFLEGELGVGGVNVAVAVEVSVTEVVDLGGFVCAPVEQGLGVHTVGDAVAVEVQREAGGRVGFAVHRPEDGGGNGQRVIGAEALHAVLAEEVAVEIQGHILFGEVGDGEAGAEGTVLHFADLDLDLAVGNGFGSGGGGGLGNGEDLDQRAGGDGVVHVSEAGALLEDGVVITAGRRVEHGDSRGHQQALRDEALVMAELFNEVIVADVLLENSGEAGDLGSGHGGTGHDLIGLAAGHSAVDGPDVAAGRGDFGLHGQAAVAAPGAEGAHGVEGGLCADALVDEVGLIGDRELAGVVGGAVQRLLFGEGLDQRAFGTRDGDDRSIVEVTGQVQTDAAGLVVVDDDADSAVCHGGVGLLIEGGGAAGADGDLAGQDGSESGKVLIGAEAVDEDVLLLADKGTERCIAVVRTLHVEDVRAVGENDRSAGHALVVHRGDGEGVGIGAGRAAGVEVDVVLVEVAVRGLIGPVVVVAGGDGDDGVVVHQVLEDLKVSVAGGEEACAGGAQGQVDGVRAHDHGVLDGDHVVRVVSAAALAEDLHDHQLRVGSFALRQHGAHIEGLLEAAVHGDVPVGGRDAGDVGAVLALGVIVVGDVQIAVNIVGGEGDLRIAVDAVGGAKAAGDVQLLPNSPDVVLRHEDDRRFAGLGALSVHLVDGILESSRVEGLVVGVQAGVDDGDLAARAGVTQQPGGLRAGHLAGGGVLNLILAGEVEGLENDIPDADDVLDGFDLAVFHVGGHHVAGQRDIPDNVELGAVQNLRGDLVGKGILLGFQPVAVARCARRCVTRVKSGCIVEHDGHADDFIVSVEGFFFQLSGIGEREVLGDGVVVDLLERQFDSAAEGLFRLCRLSGIVIGCKAGHAERQQQRRRHQQGQETFPGPTHASFLLDKILYKVLPLYIHYIIVSAAAQAVALGVEAAPGCSSLTVSLLTLRTPSTSRTAGISFSGRFTASTFPVLMRHTTSSS